MRGLIQLVSHANVKINANTVASIERGILALIGIEKTDTEREAEKLIERMISYRIFPDEDGKMNRSLIDIQGGLLLVPQFTLVADTHNGTRPGFSQGMPPEAGKKLFEYLFQFAKSKHVTTSSGVFGAHMQVNLCNDGPVTFLL